MAPIQPKPSYTKPSHRIDLKKTDLSQFNPSQSSPPQIDSSQSKTLQSDPPQSDTLTFDSPQSRLPQPAPSQNGSSLLSSSHSKTLNLQPPHVKPAFTKPSHRASLKKPVQSNPSQCQPVALQSKSSQSGSSQSTLLNSRPSLSGVSSHSFVTPPTQPLSKHFTKKSHRTDLKSLSEPEQSPNVSFRVSSSELKPSSSKPLPLNPMLPEPSPSTTSQTRAYTKRAFRTDLKHSQSQAELPLSASSRASSSRSRPFTSKASPATSSYTKSSHLTTSQPSAPRIKPGTLKAPASLKVMMKSPLLDSQSKAFPATTVQSKSKSSQSTTLPPKSSYTKKSHLRTTQPSMAQSTPGTSRVPPSLQEMMQSHQSQFQINPAPTTKYQPKSSQPDLPRSKSSDTNRSYLSTFQSTPSQLNPSTSRPSSSHAHQLQLSDSDPTQSQYELSQSPQPNQVNEFDQVERLDRSDNFENYDQFDRFDDLNEPDQDPSQLTFSAPPILPFSTPSHSITTPIPAPQTDQQTFESLFTLDQLTCLDAMCTRRASHHRTAGTYKPWSYYADEFHNDFPNSARPEEKWLMRFEEFSREDCMFYMGWQSEKRLFPDTVGEFQVDGWDLEWDGVWDASWGGEWNPEWDLGFDSGAGMGMVVEGMKKS